MAKLLSHFELYRSAMQEFAASTETIDQLLQQLQSGVSVAAAIVRLEPGPRQFLQHTFAEIQRGDLCRIAAAFTFGREGLLPDVFTRIVQRMALANPNRLKIFQYYLQRHIELDGDNHGPLAEQLVERLCGTSPARWAEAELAAVKP
jgi:hypothetical protein